MAYEGSILRFHARLATVNMCLWLQEQETGCLTTSRCLQDLVVHEMAALLLGQVRITHFHARLVRDQLALSGP